MVKFTNLVHVKYYGKQVIGKMGNIKVIDPKNETIIKTKEDYEKFIMNLYESNILTNSYTIDKTLGVLYTDKTLIYK